MSQTRTYTTSRLAKMAGIHPNTVRLCESIGFITVPACQASGYRVFTDLHVLQVRIVRAVVPVVVLVCMGGCAPWSPFGSSDGSSLFEERVSLQNI